MRKIIVREFKSYIEDEGEYEEFPEEITFDEVYDDYEIPDADIAEDGLIEAVKFNTPHSAQLLFDADGSYEQQHFGWNINGMGRTYTSRVYIKFQGFTDAECAEVIKAFNKS